MFRAALVSGLLANSKKFLKPAHCSDGTGDAPPAQLFELVRDNYEVVGSLFQRNKSQWDENWNLSKMEHGYCRYYFITPPETDPYSSFTYRGKQQTTKLLNYIIDNIIDNHIESHNFKFSISDDHKCQKFKNTDLFKKFYERLTNFLIGIKQPGPHGHTGAPHLFQGAMRRLPPRIFRQNLENMFTPNLMPVSTVKPGTVVEDQDYGLDKMEFGFGEVFYLDNQREKEGDKNHWCEIYICPKNFVKFVVTRLMQMNIDHNYGRFDIGDATVTEVRVNKSNDVFLQSVGEKTFLAPYQEESPSYRQ